MGQPLVIRRGNYELVLPLGEGRLTRVYLALPFGGPSGFGGPVVVKRLRPELGANADIRALFLEAAHFGVRLRHPNVAATHEVFVEGNESFLVMEYLEGHSLADLLRQVGRENLPLAEQLYLVRQVLLGLVHCHALTGPDGTHLGGNHREVNASNVFITYDGEVKLVDFALPFAMQAPPRRQARRPKTEEIQNGIGATSPEELCGLAKDVRSDVFSAGVLLFEALAGRPRAAGGDRAALVSARVAGSEATLASLDLDLPAALIAVCDRATALDPAQRFASVVEFLTAFDAAITPALAVAGPPELAALLVRHFQLDRIALRRRVEQHIDAAQSAPTLPDVRVVPRREAEATVSERPGLRPSHAGTPLPVALAPDEDLDVAALSGARRGKLVVGLAAAAAGLLLFTFLGGPDDQLPGAGERGAGGPSWQPITSTRPVAPERAARPAVLPATVLPAEVPAAPSTVDVTSAGVGRRGGSARRTDERAVASAARSEPPGTGAEPARVESLRPEPVRTEPARRETISPGANLSNLLPKPAARSAARASDEANARAGRPARREIDEEDPYLP